MKMIKGLAILCILMLGPITYENQTNKVSTINDCVYRDEVFDYEIRIPNTCEIKENYIYKSFIKDNFEIDVFYDDFDEQGSAYKHYIEYGNRFIKDSKYHKITYEGNTTISGNNAHVLEYERKKLSKINNDKNYYYDLAVKADGKRAYNVIVKSTKPLTQEQKDFALSIKIGNNVSNKKVPDKYFKKTNLKVNNETLEVYNKYFDKSAELTWGIFEPDAINSLTKVAQIEKQINYDFKFLIRYQALTKELPKKEIIEAYNDGKILELTLQTIQTNADDIDIYEILDGKYDEYFTNYAKEIKEINIPILFRLNNEMNGEWCQYCSINYLKDAELYRKMWVYIYNIFEENEVDNVLWVWNPNNRSFPNYSWNNALMYYPGDDYVDIIGLTAYNTGDYYKKFGEKWSSFTEIYDEYYKTYDRLSDKPLMITEFASSSYGGDKIEWTRDMFENINKYPNIKVAIWWNHTDFDEDGNISRDYKIDSPKEVLDIFREMIGDEG